MACVESRRKSKKKLRAGSLCRSVAECNSINYRAKTQSRQELCAFAPLREIIMADEKKLIKVTIDNINIEVAPGTSILNAARMIGGDVVPPAMCYYTKLQGSGGKCRTCLVEVTAGSTADPRPMPKLVASCRTSVMDGMVVKSITSERVIDARNVVVESLLINHPLDCLICAQACECHYQHRSS